MSTTAVVTTYQKITDADWVRPEPKSIKGGIFGDGIANTAAGLLGTYGMTVSTANVGLVAATGVASRRIGFVIAGILALLAFQPTLVGVLTIMPPPVMAAALLFTSVLHHDQRRPDHHVAHSRRAPDTGDRHGHDGVPGGVGVSGACSRACRIGRSRWSDRRWCWRRWWRCSSI